MVHHRSGRLLDVVDVIIEQRTRELYERFKRLLEIFHGTDFPEFPESLSSESLGDSPKARAITALTQRPVKLQEVPIPGVDRAPLEFFRFAPDVVAPKAASCNCGHGSRLAGQRYG